ncbi:hypothetical protein OG21DRAFT_1420910 [Imleria badia]|nr:hypothetical protein OG21DRAFT_1420910 [Imleria badia]
MKSLSVCAVVASAVLSALGDTIELRYPTDGTVLPINQNFTAQVVLPFSMASCIDVGIALAINSCTNGVCPQPTQALGSVLYAGPWNPDILQPGIGFYQNFTFQLSQYQPAGPAIFTLTHFCLAGAGPVPYLEYKNASVTVA